MEQKNFIDYNTVKEEPIEKIFQFAIIQKIQFGSHLLKTMTYIETQVTLQDNLWQYFVEPEEFSFLTLSPEHLDDINPAAII